MFDKLIEKLFPKKITVKLYTEPDVSSINIRLFVNDRQEAIMNCVKESGSSILIGDIRHDDERPRYNKGYGTMMMKKLLEFSGENGYTYIHGNLSTVDLDHKDRLHHFYQKFGFTITEYPEPQGNYYGKIELHL